MLANVAIFALSMPATILKNMQSKEPFMAMLEINSRDPYEPPIVRILAPQAIVILTLYF